MQFLPLLLVLFSQLSVTSTGLSVTDLDVEKVLTPLTGRTGSLFNVAIAFAGVIVIVWVVKLFIRWIRVK